MRASLVLYFLILLHFTSAHFASDIFETLVTSSHASKKAVRRPRDNGPIHDVTSNDIRCNIDTSNATETVTVEAGGQIGFRLDTDKTIYHMGPASMYLGRAPGLVADWDGSGKSWFKIAQWGAAFRPKFTFMSLNQREFMTTIPKSVPSGEYLARMEHIGLHLTGTPEVFMSCAQIKVVNGGRRNPPMVSIPGYLSKTDPGLMVDIYWPVPTAYEVPGPKVYRGQSDVCSIKSKAMAKQLPLL